MSDEIATRSALELVTLFRSRQLSPVELLTATFARIRSFNEQVNAFCLLDEERAMKQALASEARWVAGTPIDILDGIPCSVKDVMSTRDWPARRGSRLVKPASFPSREAPIVARLREAGSIFIGSTNTAEFGWKGVTDNPLYGITRNPWNIALTPGGSSGGAAAALALGMGTLATGSDAAGSIRIPASFCGLFGIKPSYGLVPTSPLSSYGTLSHQGPMGRTVADSAVMLEVISRPDPDGAPAVPYADRNFQASMTQPIAGIRIAFSPNFGRVDVDPEVARLTAIAAARFEQLGAVVEEVCEIFPEPRDILDVHWKASLRHILKPYSDTERLQIDPDMVAYAEQPPCPDLDDYLKMASRRAELEASMQRFHQRYDLLLTPTVPVQPFKAGALVADPGKHRQWFDWAPFCYPFNLTMQPAASVPCGLTEQRLPVGFQLVGPRYADALVLRAAYAYESAFPSPRLPNKPQT
ncbi:amidase [Bradyrhizobium tropiciagri]|uniref:amidase n=1 Tax=Bradyrhizobium tropiciagri TaxID=312253 RepID=UPI001BAE27D4|nr:amidase [Bradyrhizobium tropiciagri]MBR0898986.1 amidase [Bradyrhizobium tropiciagri]